MNKISWEDSVWFFDIDDTLIDTAGISSQAASGIEHVFARHTNQQRAHQLVIEFNAIFDQMVAGYRVKEDDDWKRVKGGKVGFQELLLAVEKCQSQVVDEFGTYKKFSREVFITLAADRLGISYSPELIHEAADAYWMMLTEKTVVFPHVIRLFEEIKNRKRPIYLITSSDARLTLDESGQFSYKPEYSEGLKRQRIELLRQKGLDFNLVSIGDPEDKPHKDFFLKGIRKAEEDVGQIIDLSYAIMCGDSYGGDLETPEKLGFGLIVLYTQGSEGYKEMKDNYIQTNNVYDITKCLVD